MKIDEQKLIMLAKPYFEECRAGDWKHALRVVSWTKKLGNGRKDLDILIIASYLHDIGWSGVAPKGKIDFSEMLQLEKKANANTGKFVREVLNKLKLDKDQINTIVRLIKAVDQYKSKKDDEAIVVDADNLSKLCIAHLREKYNTKSYNEVIRRWDKDLSRRIKTEKGKRLYPKLLAKLKNKFKLQQ